MDSKTFQDLEFDRFLQLIASYTASEPGQNIVLNLRPINSISVLKEKFRLIKEIKSYWWDKNLPQPAIPDISVILSKVSVDNFFLSAEEIYLVGNHLDITRKIYDYWEKRQKECPAIFELVRSIVLLPTLQKQIKQSVNAQGEILDTASPQIKKIRQNIKQLKLKIKKELDVLLNNPVYKKYWQEKIISIRQGRYVVAIKSEFQPFLKGIVHDFSRSKATCFIEPIEILPLNNQLQMNLKEEEEERKRILNELTKAIAKEREILLKNQHILSQLDVLMAITQYTVEFDGCFPEFSDHIYFKKAYHPLLLWQEKKETQGKTVPIDLKIFPPVKVVIISGPNAGGKTVTLKTLGLFVIMLQSGIPVPAEEVVLPIFDRIYSDIGDEQTLISGMSTFSAHIKRLKEISEKIEGNTLILIDEIGKGTHPTEGISLGISFLDVYREKGAITVVTTHHDMLKAYGLKEKEALNIAVGIDLERLVPTYELLYDTPGTSCALEIAERLGVENQILQRAKAYLGKNNEGDFLSEILKLKEELQTKKRFMLSLFSAFLSLKEHLEKILKEIELRKKEIYLREEKRINALLHKIEETIKSVHERKEDLKQLQIQKQILKQLKEVPVASLKKPIYFKPGDTVKLSEKFGKKIALIKSLHGNKAEIVVGSLRCQVPVSEIQEVVKQKKVTKETVNVHTYTQPVNEIYLLGKRAEEALAEIEKALDIALLYGLKQLRIVHGLGSGRLRTVIQDYLKEHPYVVGYRDGQPDEGGQGVTIVSIKY